MTFKLEPIISKITDPVVLIFDGNKKMFKSGKDAADAVFDKRLLIEEIKVVDAAIEIFLKEVSMPISNWVGEEQTFF